MDINKAILRNRIWGEKLLVRLYGRIIPSPEPRWLEPSLYGVMGAILLVLYAIILS